MLMDIWKWNAATFMFMVVTLVIDFFVFGGEKVGGIINVTSIVILVGLSVAILNFGMISPITYTVAATSTFFGQIFGIMNAVILEQGPVPSIFSTIFVFFFATIVFPWVAACEARKAGAKESASDVFVTALPCVGLFSGEILRRRKPRS